MSRRLDALLKSWDENKAAIEDISNRTDDGHLSTEDQTQYDRLIARAADLDSDITKARADEALLNKVASGNVAAGVTVTRAAPVPEIKTAGEYFSGLYTAVHVQGNPNRSDAMAEFHARSTQNQTTSSVAGILPEPIVGELFKLVDANRPVFSSFTQGTMPEKGKVFQVPQITQRVLVGEQETEKTQTASRSMTITNTDVTKRTFTGDLNLSQQSVDWTEPSMLDVVFQDFLDTYAEFTEAEAVDAFEAAVTNTDDFSSTSTENLLKSLAYGAVQVYENCKKLPNTLWISLDRFAEMASLVDGDEHPLFPILGGGPIDLSSGVFSGNPVGLRVVVAPELSTGTVIIGNSRYATAYEQRKGFLTAVEPSLLGTSVAYYGYVAFHIRAECFVKYVDQQATPSFP